MKKQNAVANDAKHVCYKFILIEFKIEITSDVEWLM